MWRNLPGGRTLEFGGIKNEDDVGRWQGRPHDGLFVDEATELTHNQVVTLSAWNRTTDPRQKCQMVLTFNPPLSSEGQWILQFFAPWLDSRHPNPAKSGEVRWFAQIGTEEVEVPNGDPIQEDGKWIKPLSRVFILAKLDDNPYLANTDYRTKLQGLPEEMRRRLLDADFTTLIKDSPNQCIPTLWVDAAMERWKKTPKPDVPLTAIGIDPSRGGDDSTTFSRLYENWFDEIIEYQGREIKSGQDVLTRLLPLINGESSPQLNLDVGGVGASVYDLLSMNDYSVTGTVAQSSTNERDKSGKLGFVNRRARDFWKFREALDPDNGELICLPDDSSLRADLISPRYTLKARGIQVESKEELRKRIHRSPNRGDAVILAWSAATGIPQIGVVG